MIGDHHGRTAGRATLLVRAVDDDSRHAQHLSGRVVKWWLPEQWAFIDQVPRTSVGKYDKRLLRARNAEGSLEVVVSGAAARQAAESPPAESPPAEPRPADEPPMRAGSV